MLMDAMVPSRDLPTYNILFFSSDSLALPTGEEWTDSESLGCTVSIRQCALSSLSLDNLHNIKVLFLVFLPPIAWGKRLFLYDIVIWML